MVNTNPRRNMPPRAKPKGGETPWSKGDPTKKIGLNTPLSEPLMLQLDWLVEKRIIKSKASFIREILERACEDEINKYQRLQEKIAKIKD